MYCGFGRDGVKIFGYVLCNTVVRDGGRWMADGGGGGVDDGGESNGVNGLWQEIKIYIHPPPPSFGLSFASFSLVSISW